MPTETELPEVDAASYRWPGELMVAIIQPGFPLPCWLRCGDMRYRITKESAQFVAMGLMISMEMDVEPQEHT